MSVELLDPDWWLRASTWVVPVLLAITLHEAAHGWAAWKLGDDTAYRLGRVTFNPFRHIDAFGTILLPAILLMTGSGFLFGYAKPVPVAIWRLRNPRYGSVLVAAAGPGANLALATISAAGLHLMPYLPQAFAVWFGWCCLRSLWFNLVLAVFNMLPLPPLDGGRVAVGLLPAPLARPLAQLERAGILILLAVLVILPMLGERLGVNLDILPWLLQGPVNLLSRIIVSITGLSSAIPGAEEGVLP